MVDTPAPTMTTSPNATTYAGGIASLVGGAVAKIVIRVIQYNWPTLLDPTSLDAIDDIFTAGAVTLSVWLTHQKVSVTLGQISPQT